MASSSSTTTTADDATTEKKMITLKSSDGVIFDVEEKVIAQSLTIKGMIEDDCTQDGIPLPNVTGSVLAKVIEYLRKHVVDSPGGGGGGDADASEELKKWDEEFVKLDWAPLFEIILAANYLNINNLLDFLCQAVADNIKTKSPEEIRQIFGIENDFTPEELEKLQKEHQWAFDP